MEVESKQSQVEEADSLSQVSEMTSEEGEVESSNMSTGGGGGGGGVRRRTVGVHFTSVDSRDLLREDDAAGAPASLETTVETVTTVEVSRNNPPRAYTLRASSPAHRRNKESPLSSDAIFHQSHAGLFNLCIVVLVAVNSRLIIENLMKYGLLINSGFWISSKSARDWPLFMCGLSLPIFPFLALLVEKMKAKSNISEGVILVLHLIIITTEIVYPAYVIHRVQSAVLPGLILILIALTGGMKLFSYAHTNNDMREILKAEEKPEPLQLTEHVVQLTEHVEYPDNLTVENMSYFMLAPTLCYQLGYPRSETVRKGWVLRQVGKLAVFLGLIGFIIEQYISPTVIKSQHPLKGNYLYAAERILKLSMPVLYVWLCLFYCLFHLWLNIVAELLRFGDREFYKDWWNAKTVEEYWRMWNMPVHKWMVRHIYFPSIRLGLSKGVAVFLVFVISALFHEVAIGVPCHMLRCWAFLGIMFQVPLVYLTNLIQDRYRNSMVGNMVFWFFFCIVGQPMCLLLYYHDVVNSTPST